MKKNDSIITIHKTETKAIMAICGPDDLDKMVRTKSNFFNDRNVKKKSKIFAECSVKSSEGFRLHKAIVRYVYNVPTVTECERMCYSESKFRCVTYSYRYSLLTHDNCLLCDRPMSQLDYYSDIEPDRDFDIYSMTDEPQMCNQLATSPARQGPHNPNNARKDSSNASIFFLKNNFSFPIICKPIFNVMQNVSLERLI